ncbi:MAG: sigma-70 family RNA polymerase sigma factor [Phycisphaerae bacterium]|nr:sigma-70 family RNA polymerase sigma factor [Phycisphaerae bacterium]
MTDDKTLIGRLKRGDKTALESIYLKYRPRLIATACSYNVDSNQAEDVLHDVFLSLTYRIREFDIQYSLYGYLRAGIVNGIRDILRRRVRQERALVHNAVPDSLLYSPQAGLIKSEETERAEDLLSVLPDCQREVVRLRIQHGLKFREIAGLQGISSSTARGRYRYGISRLRSLQL